MNQVQANHMQILKPRKASPMFCADVERNILIKEAESHAITSF